MKIQTCLLLLFPLMGNAESVRVIRFADSEPFRMGTVTARRIVHPGLGARKTTLNFSQSMPGAEFAQHVHDNSDDTILVLEGEVNLRQGDSLRLFKAGECAFVPSGQIHGTITAGTGEAIMISFQNPPDFILYTGARDSSRPGAAPPKGVITPDAVRYVSFRARDGQFSGPGNGSLKSTGSRHLLEKGKSLKSSVKAEGEQVLFVWRGGISLKMSGGATHQAGERDAVFVQGAAEFEITSAAAGTELIQIQAP